MEESRGAFRARMKFALQDRPLTVRIIKREDTAPVLNAQTGVAEMST